VAVEKKIKSRDNLTYHNLRDGDAVATAHGLIFYIFGYNHLPDRYYGFLKYIPEKLASSFDLDWLPITWDRQGMTLVRPTELYNPVNYPKLVEGFRSALPQYICWDEALGRWMIIIPRSLIADVYIPSRQLMYITRRGLRDPLEEKALELLSLISKSSGISPGFLGIHGSISLGIHHKGSDIDLSVYGATNYWRAKDALLNLEEKGFLALKRNDRFQEKRLNRGNYRGVDFVVNATRRYSEIDPQCFRYSSMGTADVECTCSSAKESAFRPAVYSVKGCSALSSVDCRLELVSEVVSMIGLYRDIVWEGETIKARGILEKFSVGGETNLRLVVGASHPGEYLDWG
jgi:predicted nucleotidyltransferase